MVVHPWALGHDNVNYFSNTIQTVERKRAAH